MKTLFSKKNLGKLLRDGGILLLILYLVETWQARHLPQGPLPIAYDILPSLSPQASPRASERLMLLYVFAPWCTVCQYSAPNLTQLQELNIQVQALALSWQDSSDVQEFVNVSGLRVPVRLGQEREENALKISAYPSYFLVSPSGDIIRAWTGYTTTVGLFVRVFLAQLWTREL